MMNQVAGKVKEVLMEDILKTGSGSGEHTGLRILVIALTEIVTGFFVAFLIEVQYGTDPCTFMNESLSRKIGLSFGTWQLLLNLVLFAVVIAASRFRYIGIGTIANMILIGYSADFFRWLWGRVLPAGFFLTQPARILLFVFSLAGMIISSAFYMNYDMGLSPYDAVPHLIDDRLPKIPFTAVRMCWDFGIIGIGCLFGGHVPIGTVLIAVFLGPVIALVGRLMHHLHRHTKK